jgi:ClpP class serine protease
MAQVPTNDEKEQTSWSLNLFIDRLNGFLRILIYGAVATVVLIQLRPDLFDAAVEKIQKIVSPVPDAPPYNYRANVPGEIICPETPVQPRGTGVALFEINGQIDSQYAEDKFYDILNGIMGNPDFGMIALRVNSPGGDGYASENARKAFQMVREQCGLPVIAVIGEQATSAGYEILLGASEIHANPASDIGGIGIRMVIDNRSEQLKKAGREITILSTGKYKTGLDPRLPLDAETVALEREKLFLELERFVLSIQASRKHVTDIAAIKTGRSWNGEQAIQMGLIDGFDPLSVIATRVLGAKPSKYISFALPVLQAERGVPYYPGVEPQGASPE